MDHHPADVVTTAQPSVGQLYTTDEVAKLASITASATPFFFCTTQKHLTVKSV